jgi:hypothetical protein
MRYFTIVLLFFDYLLGSAQITENGPICLHPENPHYFLFRGKASLLISSAEHYGSVLNKQFNYIKYLNTLQREGLNYTRLFCSGHVELADPTFGIEQNTMNPSNGNYLTPWMKVRDRRDTLLPVYDLDSWDLNYFTRLRNFVDEAGKRGIVVEITLASSCYNQDLWSKNPLNAKNNTSLNIDLPVNRVHTLYNGKLLSYQENLVQKIVKELNEYDNVIFEIQNEPWSDQPCLVEYVENPGKVINFEWQKLAEVANPVSLEWQAHICEVIQQTEAALPNKHLIAQNISNLRARVQTLDQGVSVLNFHYAIPEAASWNSGLKLVIGFDETGFLPHTDLNYRSEAWLFILAGGAIYNNLDYSFTVGHEDGTWTINNNPGWGGVNYRKQVKILKDFIESFDFVKMKTAQELILAKSPDTMNVQVLAQPGEQYAIYETAASKTEIIIAVPDGEYLVESISPVSGEKNSMGRLKSDQGKLKISLNKVENDIALRVIKFKSN